MIGVNDQIKMMEQDPEAIVEISLLTQRIPNIYEVIVYLQKRANEVSLLEYEFIKTKIEEFEKNKPELLQESLLRVVYDEERIQFMEKFRKGLLPWDRSIIEFLKGKLVCKNLRQN